MALAVNPLFILRVIDISSLNIQSVKMRLLSFIFLLLTFCCNVSAQHSKIDPLLLEASKSGHVLDYIVIMQRQEDVATQVSKVRGKINKGIKAFTALKKTSDETQADLVSFLTGHKIHYTPFFVANCVHVKSDAALMHAIASRNDVRKVVLNFNIRLERIEQETFTGTRQAEPEWGLVRIGADSLWRAGIDGKGVIIGGQDTGYDWAVSPLKSKYRGYINDSIAVHDYNWHDAIHGKSPLAADSLNPCGFNTPEPCDDNNHGTHTMGTMVGSDSLNQIGVAPAAKWVACRNMERGNGQLSTYLECFEWFLAPTDLNNANPDPSRAPHVINNSWYCSLEEGCNPGNWDALQLAVKNLKAAGVVVVVSAGNSGPSCEKVDAPPAHFEPSFSVGATMVNDTIASFSSRGPVTIDSSYRVKPDVSAPGRGVRSVIRGGGYASFSGTSMAGPHVAGTVALIIQANSSLAGEVELIEDIIRQSADPKFSEQDCGGISGQNHPNPIYGYGRINAIKAVELAMKTSVTDDQHASQLAHLKIYPNPASDEVIIEHLGVVSADDEIIIYNATGARVWAGKMTSGGILLPVRQWSAGLYLAKAERKGVVLASDRFVVGH